MSVLPEAVWVLVHFFCVVSSSSLREILHCVKIYFFFIFLILYKKKVTAFFLPQSYNWLHFFILFFKLCIMPSTCFKPYFRDYSFGDSSKLMIIPVYVVAVSFAVSLF